MTSAHERVTSRTNPRVKALVQLLRQPGERRRTGRLCVEGARELGRALDAGLEVIELWYAPALVADLHDIGQLIERVGQCGATIIEADESVMEKISYRRQGEGFVAVLAARRIGLADLTGPTDRPPLYLVCSGLEKPGNIGAIMRSADAAGAAAVLIDSPNADVYNPNCIRASTGAVFTVPIVCEPADVIGEWLRDRGIVTVAATPNASRPYDDVDYTGPCALVLGAEAEGLDDFWQQRTELTVTIPMHGCVDSLNVSVSAAVLLFEAVRQRGHLSD